MSTGLRLIRVDAGDIIGAILNKAQRTISFTKNGLDLGTAFSNVSEEVLYPIVGMRTPNEQVSLGMQLPLSMHRLFWLATPSHLYSASTGQFRSKVVLMGRLWPLAMYAHAWSTAARWFT